MRTILRPCLCSVAPDCPCWFHNTSVPHLHCSSHFLFTPAGLSDGRGRISSHAVIGGVLATVAMRSSTETGFLQPCAPAPERGPFTSASGSHSLVQQWDAGRTHLLGSVRPWRVGGTLLNTTRLALQLADYLVSVGHLPSRPEPSRFPTRVCREKQVAVSKLDLASAEDAQRPGLIHLTPGLFFRVRLANMYQPFLHRGLLSHSHSLQLLSPLMDSKLFNACLSTG